MTDNQWNAFCTYKDELKGLCKINEELKAELFDLAKRASAVDTPEYALETAVVYNTAYENMTKDDEIHYIVVGDNPGKEEQKAKNQKYLVGQSGKLAQGFFKANAELETDFRKNVIITNKTPVHTAKTKHLKYLTKNGSKCVKDLILESQIKMAEMTARLHMDLINGRQKDSFIPELWLVGYAELKRKGIFEQYRETLKNMYIENGMVKNEWNSVKVYQHFSMNCFTKDLKKYGQIEQNINKLLKTKLEELGTIHKKEIFEM